MSFYIRKSIRFGPVRLNFSKSGIGISGGVKGARISTGPRGTYINMGSNGIYYRQKIDDFGSTSHKSRVKGGAIPESSHEDMDISGVSNLVDTTNLELISQINARIHQPSYAWIVSLVSLAISSAIGFLGFILQNNMTILQGIPTFLLSVILAIIIFVFGMWVTWVTKQQENHARVTVLQYKLEDEARDKFIAVQKAFEALAQTIYLWRVISEISTWDWKRNARATSLLTRNRIKAGYMPPPFIYTKLKIFGFSLDFARLYFLPDQILIYQNGKYGSVSYNNLRVSVATTRFIENGSVPNDSQIVDYTWRYKRKDGGPDMRFSNNRRIPIVLYGDITLLSQGSLNLQFQVSHLPCAQQFAIALSDYINYRQGNHYSSSAKASSANYQQDKQPKRDTPKNTNEQDPYTILGIPTSATFDEITSAYKKMAQLYHPDKVSSLAPEYQEIAEKRMKATNAAYGQLKRQFKRT